MIRIEVTVKGFLIRVIIITIINNIRNWTNTKTDGNNGIENDIFNKIKFKNFVNNFLKAYAG